MESRLYVFMKLINYSLLSLVPVEHIKGTRFGGKIFLQSFFVNFKGRAFFGMNVFIEMYRRIYVFVVVVKKETFIVQFFVA